MFPSQLLLEPRGQFLQFPHLRLEGAQVGELLVHRGEADVGHLVQVPQPAHHQQPQLAGGDLPVPAVARLRLHPVGQLLDGLPRHRPLLAGPQQPADQLFPVERLPAAVLLDDAEGGPLDPLVGGVALAAVQALPAAADGVRLRHVPLVDDPAARAQTVRTAHCH